MRRFKVRIALRDPGAEREGLVDKKGRREIREVGTRDASAVDGPDVRGSVDIVLDLYAGQKIGVSLFPRYGSVVHPRSTRIRIHDCSDKMSLSSLDAEASLYAEVSDSNGVHDVAGRDALRGVVVIGIRT